MAPRKRQSSEPDWTYETAVQHVEAIIQNMESGDLPLEQVFEQFDQAVNSLKACDNYLQAKQAQMDLLLETLESEAGPISETTTNS